MKHTLILVTIGLVWLGYVAAPSAQETIPMPKPELLAVPVAETWLNLLDEGKYKESWKTAATYLKRAVSESKWLSTVPPVRKPLGKVISRKLKSSEFTKELPGAPDGEYVVIQFTTEFENKKSAIETVTPMKEKDGQWRVSGYFVK